MIRKINSKNDPFCKPSQRKIIFQIIPVLDNYDAHLCHLEKRKEDKKTYMKSEELLKMFVCYSLTQVSPTTT